MRRPWRRSYTTCAVEPLTGWNLGCRTISTVSLFRRVAKKSWQLLANASAATLRSPRLPRSRCSSSCRYDDPCVRPSSRPREGCNARCEKGTSTSTTVLQHWLSGRLGTTAMANGHGCRYQIFRTIRQYRNSMSSEGEAAPDSPLETR